MVDVIIFFGSMFVTIVLTGGIFIFAILFFWGLTDLANWLVKRLGGGK